MTILAVTLARGGSKGVPNKHTRMLGDRTVLDWTIDAVLGCKYPTDYVVSSDDIKILDIAEGRNVEVIRRPDHLALDATPTLPALQHAIRAFEKRTGVKYDYIVEVRATSPFKTSQDIDAMIEMLITSGADSVIGMTAIEDHHPMRAKWLDEYGRIQEFIREPDSGRRQDCIPKAYISNGTVYALTREAVMEQGKLFGHKTSLGYVMPGERSINIDTEMDWLLCKAMLERTQK